MNKDCYVQWVALTNGSFNIAIARLKFAPPEFCFVSNFILAKNYRLHGYGRSLMIEIEKLAHAKNLKRVILQATEKSTLFYKNLGYLKSRKLRGYLDKALF
jgi:N-acetylglutamate synthase-like GNAT family acetyltransferase